MNPFFLFLHDQVKGFFKAGKDVPDAESSKDRGASQAIVTSLVHASNLREAAKAEGQTARVAIFGFRFYALIWCAFFLGGFVMLAWGTGWADWFMVDVLGL